MGAGAVKRLLGSGAAATAAAVTAAGETAAAGVEAVMSAAGMVALRAEVAKVVEVTVAAKVAARAVVTREVSGGATVGKKAEVARGWGRAGETMVGAHRRRCSSRCSCSRQFAAARSLIGTGSHRN